MDYALSTGELMQRNAKSWTFKSISVAGIRPAYTQSADTALQHRDRNTKDSIQMLQN